MATKIKSIAKYFMATLCIAFVFCAVLGVGIFNIYKPSNNDNTQPTINNLTLNSGFSDNQYIVVNGKVYKYSTETTGVAPTDTSSKLSFNADNTLELIFLKDSVSELSSFSFDDNNIASVLQAEKTEDNININILYSSSTANITTSLDADYTLGTLALNTNSVVNYTDSEFTIGTTKGSTSLLGTRTQAQILDFAGGTLTLGNSTYTAKSTGRAINQTGGTLNLNNITLTGFTTTENGGAIYKSAGTLTLTNCKLTGNTAASGPAVYNNSGTLNLNGGDISSNTATTTSGDVYLSSSAYITLNASLTKAVTVYKAGLTSYDDNTGNSSVIAYSTNATYLNSAKTYITVTNYQSFHQNSTAMKTNYLVCEYKSYTATFNGNGGSNGTSITKKYKAALGTLPTSTRTGYTFNGWFTATSGGTQISTTTTMPANNITYYAHWTANTYTIYYADGANLLVDGEFNAAKTVNLAWDDSLNGTLAPYAGWASGYNSGVSNPTTGYHAHLKDISSTDPEHGNVVEYINTTNRWLGMNQTLSAGVITTGTYVLTFDVYSVSGSNYPNVGLYYCPEGSTTKGWGSGQASYKPTQTGVWERVSFVFSVTNINLTQSCSLYLYGYSATGTIYIDNVYFSKVSSTVTATYDTVVSKTAPSVTGYNFSGYNVSYAPSGGLAKAGLNTSTAKWGTTSSPATAITSSTTLLTGSTIYMKNLTPTNGGAVVVTSNYKAKRVGLTLNANGGNVTNITYSDGTSDTTSATTKTVYIEYGTARIFKSSTGVVWVDSITTSRTAYTHNGYYTATSGGTKKISASTSENLTATSTATSATTYYSQWSAISYNITYASNGGTLSGTAGTNYTTTYDITTSITLPSTTYITRTGYTFGGWKVTTAGGNWKTSDSAYSGTVAAGKYGNVTLTAQWTANIYKVTLNNQSATTAGTTEYYYQFNTTKVINGVTCYYFTSSALTTGLANGSRITCPTRTGYTFGGYYTSTGGSGTQYVDASGQTVNNLYASTSVAKDITLYAKWTGNTYTISYTLNGGTAGSSAPTNATYGTAFTVSNPTRAEYIFAGWTITGMDSCTHYVGTSSTTSTSTSASAVMGTYFNNLRATSGTVTFTAQWTEIYGLYNSTTDELIYTWQQLIDNQMITVTDGELKGNDSTMVGKLLISPTITSIGDNAFYTFLVGGFTGLTGVKIPNSVTSIGSSAFNSCGGLTSITIPNSITSIGSSAFFACYNLLEVYNLSNLDITAGSTSHGYVAYYAKKVYTTLGESNISTDEDGYVTYNDGTNVLLVGYVGDATDLTLPSNITQINPYAFYNKTNITSVSLPNSVTSIGTHAFDGCSGLTSITIPNSVTSIGTYAFQSCSGLTSVTIPNSVTSIGGDAFYNCSKLTSVTIGSSITSIGSDAFYGCTGVQTLTYNGNITTDFSSWTSAFKVLGASSATGKCEVIIGDNVTTIPAYMFYSVTSVPNGITSITIGNSVTSIGHHAFGGCTQLTGIFIPKSVTGIATTGGVLSPFYECSSSMVIYCEASGKQSGWDTYWNYYGGGYLTVYYSCTRDAAGNIYYSDGRLAVSAAAATLNSSGGVVYADAVLDNASSESLTTANLKLGEQQVIAYVERKEDDDQKLEVVLTKHDDYDTDTPPTINQTTSV